MKEITSINNEFIKKISKLKEKKERYKNNEFLIEGYHLVEEAIKANVLKFVLTNNPKDRYNVETYLVTDEIIKKLSSTTTPQGIIGVCKINNNKELLGNKFLVLDNVNDPGNVGTLIRSSLGFGIDTIILSNESVDIYNEKVIRATQGGIFNINIVYGDLKKAILELKEKEVTIIGTSLQSCVNLKEVNAFKKYAIVLGNEANGVSKEILDLTDINVRIEMKEKLESLNVAVAGSIVMYYLYTK